MDNLGLLQALREFDEFDEFINSTEQPNAEELGMSRFGYAKILSGSSKTNRKRCGW